MLSPQGRAATAGSVPADLSSQDKKRRGWLMRVGGMGTVKSWEDPLNKMKAISF